MTHHCRGSEVWVKEQCKEKILSQIFIHSVLLRRYFSTSFFLIHHRKSTETPSRRIQRNRVGTHPNTLFHFYPKCNTFLHLLCFIPYAKTEIFQRRPVQGISRFAERIINYSHGSNTSIISNTSLAHIDARNSSVILF